MKRPLLQLIEADRQGQECPVCNGATLYWDEEAQEIDVCPDYDPLNAYFRSQREPKSRDNVIRLCRNPDTGELDDIPF
jgi:hypothetical protein